MLTMFSNLDVIALSFVAGELRLPLDCGAAKLRRHASLAVVQVVNHLLQVVKVLTHTVPCLGFQFQLQLPG